jgi:hypothetical protein
LLPEELQIEKIEAITRNIKEGDADDKEFEKRLKIAEVALKEKSMNNQENRGAASRNDNDTNRNEPISQPNQRSVPRPVQQIGEARSQGGGPRGPNVGPCARRRTLIMPKEKDPRLARAGVSGYNKPKRTPNHPTKSHVVVAKCDDGKVKTIRFGQQGVSGAGKSPKTDKEKARRKSFKARHAKNIAKGKCSAAYWANKVKW